MRPPGIGGFPTRCRDRDEGFSNEEKYSNRMQKNYWTEIVLQKETLWELRNCKTSPNQLDRITNLSIAPMFDFMSYDEEVIGPFHIGHQGWH